jgi:GAF domain-containing protein
LRRETSAGVVGWAGVNRRLAINADPSLDLGVRTDHLTPALRSCCAIPLVESEGLVAVLSLYRTAANGFSDDDVRLLELLAPRLATSLRSAAAANDRQPKPQTPHLTLVKRAGVTR